MTSMEPWAKKLSEQEIWKIVAYQRNFGLRGQIFDPATDMWINPLAETPAGDTDQGR